VAGEEERDAESEREARELRRRHAQRVALVERHEGKPDVHGESRVERHGGRQAAPEGEIGETRRLGRVERDQAGGVVGQVAG